jgi:hypothetical protein
MSVSQYDLLGLYDFLKQTPEQGLRKMLCDNKPMGDVHFNLLKKVLSSCSADQFKDLAEKSDFPKIKFSPAEVKLKDKFWSDCFQTFQARGLLNPAGPVKQAA